MFSKNPFVFSEKKETGVDIATRIAAYIALILFFLLLDQLSKDYVLRNYESIRHVGQRFHLYLHLNASGTLSKFKGKGNVIALVAMTFFSASILLSLYLSPLLRRCPPYLLGICLVIAGGMGNALDLLRFGYVVDFLGFTVREPELKRWILPVYTMIFNIADLQIITGSALIAFGTIRLHRDSKNKSKETTGGENS